MSCEEPAPAGAGWSQRSSSTASSPQRLANLECIVASAVRHAGADCSGAMCVGLKTASGSFGRRSRGAPRKASSRTSAFSASKQMRMEPSRPSAASKNTAFVPSACLPARVARRLR